MRTAPGGKLLAITLWDSEKAMRMSEEAANRLRESTAETAAQQIVGVERVEVVFGQRT